MPRILIVDDEKQTVDLLSQVVQMLDHDAVPAFNCEEVLNRIQDQPPDLILLDLMMPEIDGYETMQRIRDLPAAEDIPIVVITASQELDVEERVTACGGDRVYYKPIGVAKLNDAIEEFLPEHGTAPLPDLAA